MPHLERQINLPYSSEQLFNLVNDVAAYPEFLPGCLSTHILAYTQTHMRARVTIGHALKQLTFCTENSLSFPERIEMRQVTGPLQALYGVWCFTPILDSTEIRFFLEITFRSRMMQLFAMPLIEQQADRMMDAFLTRAKDVYG